MEQATDFILMQTLYKHTHTLKVMKRITTKMQFSECARHNEEIKLQEKKNLE